jgi:GAF domain-containing protein
VGMVIRKDGTTFWATCILNPVMDEERRLLGFTNICRDITPHKRIETVQTFLSEVGAVLAGSLDPKTTVDAIARLAIREMSDWCVVDVKTELGLQRVALAHVDEARADRVRDAVLHPAGANGRMPHGIDYVIRTGRSVLQRDLVDQAWLGELLGIPPALLEELGAHSCMCVPLTARGKTFGAMTFVSDGAKLRYGPEDLSAAEELARRAALAMDNAELYRKVQQGAQLREELISMASHDLAGPLTGMKLRLEALIREGRGGKAAPMVPEQWVRRLEPILSETTRAIES